MSGIAPGEVWLSKLRNCNFVLLKPTKTAYFALVWHQLNETKACLSKAWHAITHTNPNICDRFTLNISNTSPGVPSQIHCLSEKWESFLFGKPICAQAQHVREVILSGCVLIGLLWVIPTWKKKASVSYLQPPPSHKEDQSQLEAPFPFSFKVGEEAWKPCLDI